MPRPPGRSVPPASLGAFLGAFLAAPLLAATPLRAAPAGIDPPPAHLLPLTAARGAPAGELCNPRARLCVRLAPPDEAGTVRPAIVPPGAPPPPAGNPGPDDPLPPPDTVWPALIPLADGGALAGVLTRTSVPFSGGGGGVTTLRLYRLPPAGDGGGATRGRSYGEAGAAPVLELPLDAILTIRACFDEAERRRRRGACHDEYRLDARLTLAPGTAAGLPVLAYASRAWRFPRGVSRFADSARMPALRPSDLVRERDPACTFTRRLRFDPAAGTYAPEKPLPACDEYALP